MDKKNKYYTLFNNSGCLSEEGLLKFLRNKMTSKEKHIIEMHLLDCQLCSDAIEGLQKLNDHRKFSSAIKYFKKAEINKSKTNKYLIYTSIAATIAIIFTSIYITSNFEILTKKDLSQAYKEPNTNLKSEDNRSANTPVNHSLTLETKNNGPGNAGYYYSVEKEDSSILKKSEISDNLRAGDGNIESVIVYDNTAVTESINNQKGFPATGGVTLQSSIDQSGLLDKTADEESIKDIDITKSDRNESDKKSKNKKGEKTPEKSVSEYKVSGECIAAGKANEDYKSTYNKAVELYNSLKYSEAIVKFEDYLKTFPENCEARYLCAISYYKISKSKSALKQLDIITKSNNNECFEKARFEKALILNHMGKRTEAEKIFKVIIEENDAFKDDAEKELKEK